jgi:DnaJ-class molecular chaperone
MMGVLDPLYQALGVSAGTSPEDVKKAFRRIARECHPDVAGDDPAKAERFRLARDAYEVLTDDDKRKAYEAAAALPPPPRPRKGRSADEAGAFFKAFYQRATGDRSAGARASTESTARPGAEGKTHSQTFRARAGGGPYDGLDDLFKDFGFGAGGAGSGPRVRPGASSASGRPGSTTARRGDDVVIDLEVPASVARDGGPVMAHYAHLVRAKDWKDGDLDAGVSPLHDSVALDIPAGSRMASIIRFRGLGDAGPWGGPPGDLVCRLRVVDDQSWARKHPEQGGGFDPFADRAPSERAGAAEDPFAGRGTNGVRSAADSGWRPQPGRGAEPPPTAGASRRPGAATGVDRGGAEFFGPGAGDRREGTPAQANEAPRDLDGVARQVVDITVFEALLGGRIEVGTPTGRVRMVVPPCTSSGRTFRLKGRGPRAGDGDASDLIVEVRIVTPAHLDARSVALVSELAALNPEGPER